MNRVSLPFWPLLLLATYYLILPVNASLYGYTNTTIVHYAYDPTSEVATPASSSVFASEFPTVFEIPTHPAVFSSSGLAFATATVFTNVTTICTEAPPEPTVSSTVTNTSRTETPSEPLQDVIRQEPGPFDGARSPSRAYDDTYQQLSDPPTHLTYSGLASSDATLDNYLDAHLARADSDSESPRVGPKDFANDFMDSDEKSRRFFLSSQAKRIGTFAFGPLWPWNYGVACVVNEFPGNWNPHADPPRIDDLVERFDAAIETEHRKAEALDTERQRLEATRLEEEAVIEDFKRKNDVTDWYRSLLIEKVSEYDGLVDLNTYVRNDLLVKNKADQRKREATSKAYVQAQTLYMLVKRTSDTTGAASTALVIYQRPLYPSLPPTPFELFKPSTWRFMAVWHFILDFLCLVTLLEFALYLRNERHGVPPTDPDQPGFPPGSFPPSDDDAPGSGDHQLHESLSSNLSSTSSTNQQHQDRSSRPGDGGSNGQMAGIWIFEWMFMSVCTFWSFCVLEVRKAKDEFARAAQDKLHERSSGTSGSSEARQDVVPHFVNDSVALDVPQAAAQSMNTETDAAITIREIEHEVHTVPSRPRSPSHDSQWGRQDTPFVKGYLRRRGQGRFSMRSRSPSPVTVQTREDHPVAEQSLARLDRALGAEVGLACVTTVVPSIDVRSVPDCDQTVSSADSEPVSETPLENASQSCIEPSLVVMAPDVSDTAIEEAELDQTSSTPRLRETVALVVSVDRDALDPNHTEEEPAVVEHADSLNEQAEESTISVSALANSNDMDVVSMLEEQRPAPALEPVVAFYAAETQDSARLQSTNNTAVEAVVNSMVCLTITSAADTAMEVQPTTMDTETVESIEIAAEPVVDEEMLVFETTQPHTIPQIMETSTAATIPALTRDVIMEDNIVTETEAVVEEEMLLVETAQPFTNQQNIETSTSDIVPALAGDALMEDRVATVVTPCEVPVQLDAPMEEAHSTQAFAPSVFPAMAAFDFGLP
ncbi:hypothetical protein QFC24_006469 [Naganishia onofrii]|uniref:Uncharacterized protein n=1 Tax=Naganishia onofrii TaxID=1851511 RepID=A0ACC2X1V6_9TREE|nr:hypothetical protein QFC24_006469 [Naganishia onofrii]